MAEQVLNVTGLAARVEDKQLLHGVDLNHQQGRNPCADGTPTAQANPPWAMFDGSPPNIP